ncbi:MAG: iron-sulfur cluster repair di-iron protein [Flavobacteriaceae bacterium]
MNINENKTVAEVVTENIKASNVFKKHGIDFCCGGGISLEKACAKHKVDYKMLELELNAVDEAPNRSHDYNSWELGFLIDHIVNVHHSYVEQSLPIISQYAEKVATVHGHHHDEVVEINRLFQEAAGDLAAHLKKEELVLFPFIKQLIKADKEGTDLKAAHFGTVNNPINMMESEHETVGDIFKKIAKLSDNYTPPAEACNTFRALYASLQEFEEDLHQHIHLENNILHGKAIALEKKLLG